MADIELHKALCNAAGWEWAWHEKLEWRGGWRKRIMFELPGAGTVTEFVLDHNMAALLREEIDRRELWDEFIAALGDNDWERANATPEQTARAFLAALEDGE